MRFIHRYAYVCADYLMKTRKESHEKRRVYYFGFQVVFGAMVKGILLLSICLLLGVLKPTLTTVAVFVILRSLAGGYHMDTYGKCITVSLGMFVASGIIVQYTNKYWNESMTTLLPILTFILCIPLLFMWAPSDNPNRPITKVEEIKKFKSLSIAFAVIALVIELILIEFKLSTYAVAMCFGVLIETFAITPIGYKFFDMINGSISKVNRKKLSSQH